MAAVEVLIVAIWVASMAAVVVGAVGVMREWAKAATPRHQPAHAKPARPAQPSLLEQLLVGWRELAHAHALMTGGQPW